MEHEQFHRDGTYYSRSNTLETIRRACLWLPATESSYYPSDGGQWTKRSQSPTGTARMAARHADVVKHGYSGMILKAKALYLRGAARSRDQSITTVCTVEAKCSRHRCSLSSDSKSQLGVEQWQALHRTLLYEHHDFADSYSASICVRRA